MLIIERIIDITKNLSIVQKNVPNYDTKFKNWLKQDILNAEEWREVWVKKVRMGAK